MDGTYLIPITLVWSDCRKKAKTKWSIREVVELKNRKEKIKAAFSTKIPGVDIEDLFISFSKYCGEDSATIGILFEKFVIASMVVKCYLVRKCIGRVSLGGIFEHDDLYKFEVDISSLARLSDEVFSDKDHESVIFHNLKTNSAHHDAVFTCFNKDKETLHAAISFECFRKGRACCVLT